MYLLLNVATGGAYPFKINGVRSPYYGVAAETVDVDPVTTARMLVDWVCARDREAGPQPREHNP